MTTPVTEKSTKSQIIEAYNEAIAKLKETKTRGSENGKEERR